MTIALKSSNLTAPELDGFNFSHIWLISFYSLASVETLFLFTNPNSIIKSLNCYQSINLLRASCFSTSPNCFSNFFITYLSETFDDLSGLTYIFFLGDFGLAKFGISSLPSFPTTKNFLGVFNFSGVCSFYFKGVSFFWDLLPSLDLGLASIVCLVNIFYEEFFLSFFTCVIWLSSLVKIVISVGDLYIRFLVLPL